MPDLDRTISKPPEPMRGMARSSETFEAVDRLMAMATEKRSDRVPAPQAASSALALPLDPRSEVHRSAPEIPSTAPPSGAVHTAGRLLSALRPIMPALGAALRMVDHGAVQAAARLLPLLAGIGAQEPPNSHALLEAGLREHRKEIDELRAELVTAEEQLTQLRWKSAQLETEQSMQTLTMAKLTSRVRLLSLAIVFLLPLVAALVVLLFVNFHN